MTPKRPAKMPDVLLVDLIRGAEATGAYRFVAHAAERLAERAVTLAEVKIILRHGHREPGKDEYKSEHQAWNYALRGRTLDGRQIRLALAPDGPGIFIITVIDLTKKDPS